MDEIVVHIRSTSNHRNAERKRKLIQVKYE